MKKIIYLIPAFICLSVSCQKNNDVQTGGSSLSQEKLVEFSFRTGPDQEGEQTRTHLDADGKTVIWQAGDKISVFANGNNYEFSTQENGPSVEFKGTISESDASAEEFYALYPYDATATISGGVITTASVTNNQPTVTGSFANGVNQSVAKTSSQEKVFIFKNVCALIRVIVPQDLDKQLKEVMISTNGGEKFVKGSVSISYTGDNPEITSSAVTNSDVMIQKQEGIPAGTYFLPVCPLASVVSGLRAKLSYVDGRTPEYLFSGKSVSLKAGEIFRFGTLRSQPSYLFEDFESYESVPVWITGNTNALSIIENPVKTSVNSSAKVLSNDMHTATHSTSGYVTMNFSKYDGFSTRFPYAARDKFKAVRIKVYIGASDYYPRLRIDANATYGNKIPSTVNGEACTSSNYASLLKKDDWNLLEFNLESCGYTMSTKTFANLTSWQIRPFSKKDGTNADETVSDTNQKLCYIDDVEFLYF